MVIKSTESKESTARALIIRPEHDLVPFMAEKRKKWSDMDVSEKAEEFAETGNFTSLAASLVTHSTEIYAGNLEAKKTLLITALGVAARTSLSLSAQGIYPDEAYEFAEIGETLAEYQQNLMNIAIDIANLLTEEDLINYIKSWLPHIAILETEKKRNDFNKTINSFQNLNDVHEFIESINSNLTFDKVEGDIDVISSIVAKLRRKFDNFVVQINEVRNYYELGQFSDYEQANSLLPEMWLEILNIIILLNSEADGLCRLSSSACWVKGNLEGSKLPPNSSIAKNLAYIKDRVRSPLDFLQHNLGPVVGSLTSLTCIFEGVDHYYSVQDIGHSLSDFEDALTLIKQAIVIAKRIPSKNIR